MLRVIPQVPTYRQFLPSQRCRERLGVAGGARTRNHGGHIPRLYQLSYSPTDALGGGLVMSYGLGGWIRTSGLLLPRRGL